MSVIRPVDDLEDHAEVVAEHLLETLAHQPVGEGGDLLLPELVVGDAHKEHLDEALDEVLHHLGGAGVLLRRVDVQVPEEAVLEDRPVLVGEIRVPAVHHQREQDFLVLVEVLLVMVVEVVEIQAAPVVAVEEFVQLGELIVLYAPEDGLAGGEDGRHGAHREIGLVGHFPDGDELYGLVHENAPERMLDGPDRSLVV